MDDEGPRLLEKVNATPKYLSSQNGYRALELLPADSQPIVYLKMIDPSAENQARKGKEGDFFNKGKFVPGSK